MVDLSKQAGYHSSLIILFLESPKQSFERVAARNTFEDGLFISPGNVQYNFNENFRNVSKYFFYFDESFFIYTGEKGKNELIMEFHKTKLINYKKNNFLFIQKFAQYAHQLNRLEKIDLDIILANNLYRAGISRKNTLAKDWLTPGEEITDT